MDQVTGGLPELVFPRRYDGVGIEEGEASLLVGLTSLEVYRTGGASSPEMERRRRSAEKGFGWLFCSGFWLRSCAGARDDHLCVQLGQRVLGDGRRRTTAAAHDEATAHEGYGPPFTTL